MLADLATYDVIEVSSSGGKDSLAMLRYVIALARAAGVLDRVVVVHADLGRIEWPGSREIAEAQAMLLGAPRFVAVKRPQGDLLQHVEAMGYWPKPRTRYCTAMHKRGQILRVLTQLAREVRERRPLDDDRPIRILNCIGLRAQESGDRARLAAAEDLRDLGISVSVAGGCGGAGQSGGAEYGISALPSPRPGRR